MRAFFGLGLTAMLPATMAAQGPLQPHSRETLTAVLTFVDYDEAVPLNAQVAARDSVLGFGREKVVFTGAHGDRVPSFLALPKGTGPFPVILLIHAGASSKNAWWDPGGYERAIPLTRGLLEAGYAVFALDALNHGERGSNIDFVPIVTLYFQNGWWATYRTMVNETVADYRRALDYLNERPDVDATLAAAIGQSMGGIIALHLAAADHRVKSVVAGSAAISPVWLYPITPVNLSPALSDCGVLLIAGRPDEFVGEGDTERLHSLIPSGDKRLLMLDSGHRLTEEYVLPALEWTETHLIKGGGAP